MYINSALMIHMPRRIKKNYFFFSKSIFCNACPQKMYDLCILELLLVVSIMLQEPVRQWLIQNTILRGEGIPDYHSPQTK